MEQKSDNTPHHELGPHLRDGNILRVNLSSDRRVPCWTLLWSRYNSCSAYPVPITLPFLTYHISSGAENGLSVPPIFYTTRWLLSLRRGDWLAIRDLDQGQKLPFFIVVANCIPHSPVSTLLFHECVFRNDFLSLSVLHYRYHCSGLMYFLCIMTVHIVNIYWFSRKVCCSSSVCLWEVYLHPYSIDRIWASYDPTF